MISVIVPVLNEADTIASTIAELDDWFRSAMPGQRYEIVIVNDGSTDATANVLSGLTETHPWVRRVDHAHNIGRGQAVRTGLSHANGDYIVTIDADLSYSPDHIKHLLEPLQRGEADITLASAYHPDGRVQNVPLRRALFSRLGNWVLGLGTYGELHTVTCIVRGFRKDAMLGIDLINTDKDLHLEIIQKAQLFGLRIKEVPANLVWRDRKRKTRTLQKKKAMTLLPGRGSVVGSHLAYGFSMRPGLFVIVPLVVLSVAIVLGGLTLAYQFLQHLLAVDDGVSLQSVYQSIRTTLIDGNLTMIIVFFLVIILMQFFAFVMIASQNKRTYEELVVLMGRMSARINALQSQRKSESESVTVKEAARKAS